MKINHLPIHLGLGLTLWSSLLLPGIAPQAQAQNLSDVTGPIMTTTDMFGFGTRGRRTRLEFRTSRIQVAVNQAATSLISLLQAGNFVIVTRGTNVAISPSVQQALLIVLTGNGNVSASINQLVNSLINPRQTKAELKAQAGNIAQDSNRTTLAQNLVSSLTGLATNGKVDPVKLRTSVRAYNAFINASSGDYLSNPPDEFLAIQSVLSTLLNAAQTT